MKQKQKNDRPNRLGLCIFVMIVSIILFLIVSSMIIDEIYYASSAPIVTPEYSAQELWDNPLATPEWITQISTVYEENYFFDKSLCVSVHMYPLWDWEQEDRDQILRNTTSITIDRMIVSRRDMLFGNVEYGQLNCEKCTIDEPNTICFDSPNTEAGLHTATIRIESNSGIAYSHEWAFQVED